MTITPYYDRDGITIYCGDCLEVMLQLEANTVATILTDPPYGLSFMGKDWDHGIPGVPFWQGGLRLAMPGATLMAFGGTRTYHRLAVAIEDANWQIRDSISYMHDGDEALLAFLESLSPDQLEAYLEIHYPSDQMEWIYGSGFPKSGDVGKLIDKGEKVERESVGIKTYGEGEQFLNRKGHKSLDKLYGNGQGMHTSSEDWEKSNSVTLPATPLAQEFDGWFTALKPAHEPIIVAMKPVDGNYANNAEKWGVSGMWIDGGRIEGGKDYQEKKVSVKFSSGDVGYMGNHQTRPYVQERIANGLPVAITQPHSKGRYPANLIHDGGEQARGVFDRVGERTSGNRNNSLRSDGNFNMFKGLKRSPSYSEGSTGSAARYFYCSKSSTKERGEGNTHPTVKPLELLKYLARLTRTPTGGLILDPFLGSGTTLLAARAENRPAIGIDINEEYCAIAVSRLKNVPFVSAPSDGRVKSEPKPQQMSLF